VVRDEFAPANDLAAELLSNIIDGNAFPAPMSRRIGEGDYFHPVNESDVR
jgi:hypothetical protein